MLHAIYLYSAHLCLYNDVSKHAALFLTFHFFHKPVKMYESNQIYLENSNCRFHVNLTKLDRPIMSVNNVHVCVSGSI